MNKFIVPLMDAIRKLLTDDLRKKKYKGNKNHLAGHCYIASEVMYHLLGGRERGFKPMFIRHESEPHWFLLLNNNIVIDVTDDQFSTRVPYHLAKGKGFLTKKPSKRSMILIDRLYEEVGRGIRS